MNTTKGFFAMDRVTIDTREAASGPQPLRTISDDPGTFSTRKNKSVTTRRRFLSDSILLATGVAVSGMGIAGCSRSDDELSERPLAKGYLMDTIKFVDEGDIKTNTVLGSELDGRLFFNHSQISPEELVTPTEKFFIRTRSSKLLDLKTPWSISIVSGKGRKHLSTTNLLEKSAPLGLHLMECAGNPRGGHFGLISLAQWEGVPISTLFDQVGIARATQRVMISGFDTYESSSENSIPGASWIFSVDDLAQSGAFLATKMNGRFLTVDHGAPVRLVVPGWYGCCCIKWVKEISTVQNDLVATSQMQEYAGRTHQDGIPILARDYEPATVDAAAMPIRVERWNVNGRILYKVVGIYWGGGRPIKSLSISFNGGSTWIPVQQIDKCTDDSWALWSQTWSPENSGTHRIRLKVNDPNVRTRRLDVGYYERGVEILSR